jgi:hypothetical protein
VASAVCSNTKEDMVAPLIEEMNEPLWKNRAMWPHYVNAAKIDSWKAELEMERKGTRPISDAKAKSKYAKLAQEAQSKPKAANEDLITRWVDEEIFWMSSTDLQQGVGIRPYHGIDDKLRKSLLAHQGVTPTMPIIVYSSKENSLTSAQTAALLKEWKSKSPGFDWSTKQGKVKVMKAKVCDGWHRYVDSSSSNHLL